MHHLVGLASSTRAAFFADADGWSVLRTRPRASGKQERAAAAIKTVAGRTPLPAPRPPLVWEAIISRARPRMRDTHTHTASAPLAGLCVRKAVQTVPLAPPLLQLDAHTLSSGNKRVLGSFGAQWRIDHEGHRGEGAPKAKSACRACAPYRSDQIKRAMGVGAWV